MVLVEVVPPEGRVREKNWPQEEETPETLMQASTMSAMVSICAMGTVSPEGTLTPGTVPEPMLTSCEARVKAEARTGASDEPEPTAVRDVMKGARAYTPATVVSSLTLMKEEE